MVTCHLCPGEAAPEPCVLCERPSCAAHRWALMGVCHACATAEDAAAARILQSSKPHPQEYLDIKWVD